MFPRHLLRRFRHCSVMLGSPGHGADTAGHGGSQAASSPHLHSCSFPPVILVHCSRSTTLAHSVAGVGLGFLLSEIFISMLIIKIFNFTLEHRQEEDSTCRDVLSWAQVHMFQPPLEDTVLHHQVCQLLVCILQC